MKYNQNLLSVMNIYLIITILLKLAIIYLYVYVFIIFQLEKYLEIIFLILFSHYIDKLYLKYLF